MWHAFGPSGCTSIGALVDIFLPVSCKFSFFFFSSGSAFLFVPFLGARGWTSIRAWTKQGHWAFFYGALPPLKSCRPSRRNCLPKKLSGGGWEVFRGLWPTDVTPPKLSGAPLRPKFSFGLLFFPGRTNPTQPNLTCSLHHSLLHHFTNESTSNASHSNLTGLCSQSCSCPESGSHPPPCHQPSNPPPTTHHPYSPIGCGGPPPTAEGAPKGPHAPREMFVRPCFSPQRLEPIFLFLLFLP